MSTGDWVVARSSVATAYLVGLREEGRALRQAIHSLQRGIPEDAYQIQEEPETWEWLEARHWITFIVDRIPNRRTIQIIYIESATVE